MAVVAYDDRLLCARKGGDRLRRRHLRSLVENHKIVFVRLGDEVLRRRVGAQQKTGTDALYKPLRL